MEYNIDPDYWSHPPDAPWYTIRTDENGRVADTIKRPSENSKSIKIDTTRNKNYPRSKVDTTAKPQTNKTVKSKGKT